MVGWLPDLRRWAEVIAHFLRPGGTFYITEIHPVIQAFDDADASTALQLRYPYFSRPQPLELSVEGSYADRSFENKETVEYAWVHDLGEIVSSIAAAGLRIEFLHEHPFNAWRLPFIEKRDEDWWLPADSGCELPLSFSLKATKA